MEASDRDGLPDQVDDFSEVFDTFAPAVLRFARRRVGDNDAAWDIVSDTFTAAWRHWHRRPGHEAARRDVAAPDPADGVVLNQAVTAAMARAGRLRS
jgi:hypothetical protein